MNMLVGHGSLRSTAVCVDINFQLVAKHRRMYICCMNEKKAIQMTFFAVVYNYTEKGCRCQCWSHTDKDLHSLFFSRTGGRMYLLVRQKSPAHSTIFILVCMHIFVMPILKHAVCKLLAPPCFSAACCSNGRYTHSFTGQ